MSRKPLYKLEEEFDTILDSKVEMLMCDIYDNAATARNDVLFAVDQDDRVRNELFMLKFTKHASSYALAKARLAAIKDVVM